MSQNSPYYGMSLSGNPNFNVKSPSSPANVAPRVSRPRAKEIKHREPPFEFTFIPELYNLSSDFVYPLASKTESHPELKIAPESQPSTPLMTPSFPAALAPSTPPVLPTQALSTAVPPTDAPYIPSSRTGGSGATSTTTSTSTSTSIATSNHSSSANTTSSSTPATGPAALLASLPQHIQDDSSNPVISLIKVGTQLITRRQQLRNAERLLSQQAGGFLSVLQREEKKGQLLSGIVQNVRQTRKYLLSRISNPRWEIAHHYHTTALEHSLGRKQPNVIEVAEMLPGHLAIYAMARRTTLSQKVLIYFLNRAKKSRTTASERIKTTYGKLKSCRQSGKEVDASLAAVKKTAREVRERLLLGLLKPMTGNNGTSEPGDAKFANSAVSSPISSPEEENSENRHPDVPLSANPSDSTSSELDVTTQTLVRALEELMSMLATEESANGLGIGMGMGMSSGANAASRPGVRARFLQSLNIAPGVVDDSHIDFTLDGVAATASGSGSGSGSVGASGSGSGSGGDVANVQAMLTDIEQEMQRRLREGDVGASATREKGYYSDVTTNEALVAEEGYRSTATLMKVLPRPIQYDDSVEDNESKLLVSGATDEEEEERLRREREQQLEKKEKMTPTEDSGSENSGENPKESTSEDSENRENLENSGFGEDGESGVDSAVHAELRGVAQLLASIADQVHISHHSTILGGRTDVDDKNDKCDDESDNMGKGTLAVPECEEKQSDTSGKLRNSGNSEIVSSLSDNAPTTSPSSADKSTPSSPSLSPSPSASATTSSPTSPTLNPSTSTSTPTPTVSINANTTSSPNAGAINSASTGTGTGTGTGSPSGPQQLRVYALARSQQQQQQQQAQASALSPPTSNTAIAGALATNEHGSGSGSGSDVAVGEDDGVLSSLGLSASHSSPRPSLSPSSSSPKHASTTASPSLHTLPAHTQQDSQTTQPTSTSTSTSTFTSTSQSSPLASGQSPRQPVSLLSSLHMPQGQSPRQASSFSSLGLSHLHLQGQSPRQSSLLSSLHMPQGQSPGRQPASILSSLGSLGGSSFAFGQGQSPRQSLGRSVGGVGGMGMGMGTGSNMGTGTGNGNNGQTALSFDASSFVNTISLPSATTPSGNTNSRSGISQSFSGSPSRSNLSKALSSSSSSSPSLKYTTTTPSHTKTPSTSTPPSSTSSTHHRTNSNSSPSSLTSSLVASEDNVLPAPKSAGLSSMLRKAHLSPKDEESILLGSLSGAGVGVGVSVGGGGGRVLPSGAVFGGAGNKGGGSGSDSGSGNGSGSGSGSSGADANTPHNVPKGTALSPTSSNAPSISASASASAGNVHPNLVTVTSSSSSLPSSTPSSSHDARDGGAGERVGNINITTTANSSGSGNGVGSGSGGVGVGVGVPISNLHTTTSGANNAIVTNTTLMTNGPTIVTNGPTRIITTKSGPFASLHPVATTSTTNTTILPSSVTVGVALGTGMHSSGNGNFLSQNPNGNMSVGLSSLPSTALTRQTRLTGRSSIITISGHHGLATPTTATTTNVTVTPTNITTIVPTAMTTNSVASPTNVTAEKEVMSPVNP